MFRPWWTLGLDSLMLAIESQAVVALRLAKLAMGGSDAQTEAQRMISEKIAAAGEAVLLLASGGTTAGVIAGYRRKVRANHRRLAR